MIVVCIPFLVVFNIGDCVDDTLYELDTMYCVDDLNSVDDSEFLLFTFEVVISVVTFCVEILLAVEFGFELVVIFEVVISLVVMALLCLVNGTDCNLFIVVDIGTVFLLFGDV